MLRALRIGLRPASAALPTAAAWGARAAASRAGFHAVALRAARKAAVAAAAPGAAAKTKRARAAAAAEAATGATAVATPRKRAPKKATIAAAPAAAPVAAAAAEGSAMTGADSATRAAAVASAKKRGVAIASGGDPSAPLGAFARLKGARNAEEVWESAASRVARERADNKLHSPSARARDLALRQLDVLITTCVSPYREWLSTFAPPEHLHPYEFALAELSLAGGVAEYRATVSAVSDRLTRMERFAKLATKTINKCSTAAEIEYAARACIEQLQDMFDGSDDSLAPVPPSLDDIKTAALNDGAGSGKAAAAAASDSDGDADADGDVSDDTGAAAAGDDGPDLAAVSKAAEAADAAAPAAARVRRSAAQELTHVPLWPTDALLVLHRQLSALHVLDAHTPTVALVGAPNVGKSSLVRALSTGTPAVANYAFTTKGISAGHMYLPNAPASAASSAALPSAAAAASKSVNSTTVQVTDTPGLLYRDDSARNKLEHFTLALLTHLTGGAAPAAPGKPQQQQSTTAGAAAAQRSRPVIVFVVDASGHCTFPLAMQLQLRREMFDRFALQAADSKAADAKANSSSSGSGGSGGSGHQRHVWLDVVNKLDLGFRYFRYVNAPASDSAAAAAAPAAAAAAVGRKRKSATAAAAPDVPLEWREHDMSLVDPNTPAVALTAAELAAVQQRAVQLLGYTPHAFVSTATGAGLDALRTVIADAVLRGAVPSNSASAAAAKPARRRGARASA